MNENKIMNLEIPPRLVDKLNKTKEKLMVPKTSIAKLALNKFCDEVLG